MPDDTGLWVYPPFVESNRIAFCRMPAEATGDPRSFEVVFEDQRSIDVPYERLPDLQGALGISDSAALVDIAVEVRSEPEPRYAQLDDNVYVGPDRSGGTLRLRPPSATRR